jgi:hypothetical protein
MKTAAGDFGPPRWTFLYSRIIRGWRPGGITGSVGPRPNDGIRLDLGLVQVRVRRNILSRINAIN